MAERKKRGKVSKVDLLPTDIKAKLDELLREGKLTQKDILYVVNDLIEQAGLGENATLSAAGVNRYSTQMHTAGQRIQEARAVSEQWVTQLGDKPTGDVSKILIEMVRTIAFDSVLKHSESDEPMNPKMIKDLSLGIANLEKAASEGLKREKEIRKAFAEEAAKVVDKVSQQAGLTSQGAQDIKNEILGIANA